MSEPAPQAPATDDMVRFQSIISPTFLAHFFSKAMVLDPEASAPNQVTANSPEAVQKAKGSPTKRVCSPIDFCPLFLSQIFVQTPEKRPEVRLLEYYEIPNIIIGPRLFYAQKLIANAKRAKTSHLTPGTSTPAGKLIVLSLFPF